MSDPAPAPASPPDPFKRFAEAKALAEELKTLAPWAVPAAPRSAQQVIDAAIKENAGAERVFMTISVSMAASGLGLLLWSALAKNGYVAFSGFTASSLCGYGMRMLWKIRAERYSLRLTELLLEKAKTAEEAAEVLAKLVEAVFKPGLRLSGMPSLPGGTGRKEI